MIKTMLPWIAALALWGATEKLMALQAVTPVDPQSERKLKRAGIEKRMIQVTKDMNYLSTTLERLQRELAPSPVELELEKHLKRIEEQFAIKPLVPDDQVMSELLKRRVDLMLELEGLELRRELMPKELQPRHELAKSQLIAKLDTKKQLLEFCLANLAAREKLKDKGLLKASDLDSAKLEVTNAKFELFEVENQLKQLESDDGGLGQISVEVAVKKAQLKLVEQLLAEGREAKVAVAERNKIADQLKKLKAAREAGEIEVLKSWEQNFAEQKALSIQLKLESEMNGEED